MTPLIIPLSIAFILDLLLGDPLWLPHPIRWMGFIIASGESRFRKMKIPLFYSGALLSLCCIIGTYIIVWLILALAMNYHMGLFFILEIIFLFYSLSIHSLNQAAIEIYHVLQSGNLDQARQKVSMIVGRDTENLDESGIARATIETVSENFVDGILSPIFYALIGGAPLAMAFKMISTLDSMIGYRNTHYIQFGKFAARIDDIANYIPARLSLVIISLSAEILFGTGKQTIKTALNEGHHHLSPNSGYPEASFSGAIGIKLNGPNYYNHVLVVKPFIGNQFDNAAIFDIPKACSLLILSSIVGLIMGYGLKLVFLYI